MYYKEERPEASLLTLGERNKAVAEAWKSSDTHIRERCINLSASSKNCSSELTEVSRADIIRKKIAKVSDLLGDLNDLGCAAVFVAQEHPEKSWQVARVANPLAVDFEKDLAARLMVYIENQRTGNGYRSWTTYSVKEMFNEKWVQAGGKGYKPNYSAVGIDYDVVGLPAGVPFHRWQDYGKKQVESIMKGRRDVEFLFRSVRATTATPPHQPGHSRVSVDF